MANKYDKVELDIENLWGKQKILFDPQVKFKSGQSLSFYRRYFYYPLRYKIFRRLRRKGLYEKLIRANLLAGWRLSKHQFIKPFLINPEIDDGLSGNYDMIFRIQVLEHLPRPLSVVKHLYNLLDKNGIFVFDFIKSEGKGLDTLSAAKQRDETLDFIESHFLVLSGSLNN